MSSFDLPPGRPASLPFASPSSSPSSFFLPPSPPPPRHALAPHHLATARHPSSSLAFVSHHPPTFLPLHRSSASLSLSLLLSPLFPLLAESAPPLHRGRTRLFSFFGIPTSLPFLREDSLQWREFTRDSRVHRMPAPIPSPPSVRLSFVKRLARLTENGTGGGGGGEGNEMIISCCDFLEIDWKRSLRRGNRRVLNFQLSFFPERRRRRRRRTLRGNESSCDDDESPGPVEWREVCGVCGEVNGGLG